MSLRILRARGDAALRQLDGLRDVRPKLGVQGGRRFLQVHGRSAERAEVVIHGDRAAEEEQVQPHDARQAPVRRRLVRSHHHGFSQEIDGFFVLKIVGKIRGPLTQRFRLCNR